MNNMFMLWHGVVKANLTKKTRRAVIITAPATSHLPPTN
jgi:hypothetical protein